MTVTLKKMKIFQSYWGPWPGMTGDDTPSENSDQTTPKALCLGTVYTPLYNKVQKRDYIYQCIKAMYQGYILFIS